MDPGDETKNSRSLVPEELDKFKEFGPEEPNARSKLYYVCHSSEGVRAASSTYEKRKEKM